MDSHFELAPGEKLSCARCKAGVKPGRGGFYVIRIDALCDPTPPEFTAEDFKKDFTAEIERLTSEMAQKSEEELMDSVYKRKFLCLCAKCYGPRIKNPAG